MQEGIATPSPQGADTDEARSRAPRWLFVASALLTLAVIVVGVLVVHELRRPPETVGAKRVKMLESAVRRSPADIGQRRQLALAYQQIGRDRSALRQYETILDAAPEDLSALYNKGLLLMRRGDESEGERTLLTVLSVAPSHALAAEALGTYYADAREFDRLLSVVVPAADAHRELADLQYLAGVGYENSGEPDKAEARYLRAVELMPGMAKAERALDRLESLQ